jgi:arylsulfatase
MFPDNLGWGEVGVYGGVRGQLTPRIDKLAAEGIRLNTFNVEFSGVVSRAAPMESANRPTRDSTSTTGSRGRATKP